MLSLKITILVFVTLLIFVDHSDAWRRRRRRSCPLRDCQVSSWSYWSSCSAFACKQHGTQSRSRTEVSSASCGGAPCPDLYETQQCYGTTPVNCQLSPWSEWSACTTPCGILGTQSSSRHRITAEQCGGICTSTIRITRACPELSCLNGGSLKGSICFCKEGYSGECCEKAAGSGKDQVDCQLSSWSEWSACTTLCGVSGTQSSSRHRIALEQYGGTCTSTFRKTRTCPDLSCLNGGSLQDGTCFCKEGYSGECCQKEANKHLLAMILTPCLTLVVPCCVAGIIYGVYRWYYKDRVRPFNGKCICECKCC
ncbi:spondin-1-like [Oculina patagonica]